MVKNILENSNLMKNMEMEHKISWMEVGILENGKRVHLTAMDLLSHLMGKNIKENGMKVLIMAKENIFLGKGNGKETSILENFRMGKNTAKGHIFSQIIESI